MCDIFQKDFKNNKKKERKKRMPLIESVSMWYFEIGFFLQYNSLKNNKNETRNKFVWCIKKILPLIYHKIYFVMTEQWSTIFHMDNNPILPPSCLSLNIIDYIWNIDYVFFKGGSGKRLWQVGKMWIFLFQYVLESSYVFLDITDLFPKCLGSNLILLLTHVVISRCFYLCFGLIFD